MRRLKGNKKGSVLDLLWIAVALLFFSIVTLFGYKFVNSFNDHISGMDSIPENAKTTTTYLEGQYESTLDNGFLFLTIGLGMVTLVLASLVRIHPVFIPFFLIAFVIVLVMCGVFSNVYQEMAANSELSVEADNLTFISHVMTYLPLIIGVIGFVLMFIMYKLWSMNV